MRGYAGGSEVSLFYPRFWLKDSFLLFGLSSGFVSFYDLYKNEKAVG